MALLVQVSRLYDVMLAIYTEINPDKAMDMVRIHSGGELLGPDPAWYDAEVTGE
jgi:hypothetical protein